MTDHSRVGYTVEEQAAVHDELKQFLGSDDESDDEDDEDYNDDEEGEADKAPVTLGAANSSRKRKREEREGTEESKNGGEENGIHLAQRLKRSSEYENTLKESSAVGIPTRTAAGAGDEADGSYGGIEDGYAENADYDEDELEKEMLVAFENGDFDESAEAIGADND
jgi:RNA polymerase II subunit A C-terminal domain phosphatase